MRAGGRLGAGDVGELLFGVNIEPAHIAVLTSAEGVEEIRTRLKSFEVEPPSIVERELARKAEIDFKQTPVSIKSFAGRFNIDGQRLDVHGDLRIKVGEWDWGDPAWVDWDEFWRVVKGDGPMTHIRLGYRKAMWDTHAWIREAFEGIPSAAA